jgi:hypothetical protein
MHPCMRRRQKKEEVMYPHPLLVDVLKRTLGVPLFQIADFSGTGLTIGKHPMEYRLPTLARHQILSSEELRHTRDGEYVGFIFYFDGR